MGPSPGALLESADHLLCPLAPQAESALRFLVISRPTVTVTCTVRTVPLLVGFSSAATDSYRTRAGFSLSSLTFDGPFTGASRAFGGNAGGLVVAPLVAFWHITEPIILTCGILAADLAAVLAACWRHIIRLDTPILAILAAGLAAILAAYWRHCSDLAVPHFEGITDLFGDVFRQGTGDLCECSLDSSLT